MPLRERVHWWRKGFLTRSSVIYPFDEKGPEKFVTDVERERANKINIQNGISTRNKLLFGRQLRSNPSVDYPAIYGIIANDRIFPEESNICEVEDVLDTIKRRDKVVLKPIYGYRGKGIYMLQHNGDENYILNGSEKNREEVTELINSLSRYIITEYIHQAEYLNKFYPDATNTIRMVTICHKLNNSPTIVAAIQRIGTKETAPIDNWSKGGLAAQINQNTGELMSAIVLRDGSIEYLDTHPDTDVQITDQKIPSWDSIQEQIIEAAQTFPELPYLAWDIVPQDNSSAVIIEANAFPDVDITQLREPLLAVDSVEEFFTDYDVLSRTSH